MKTLQQVKEQYKSETFDGRDLSRLAEFIPESELNDFGMSLKEEYVGKHKHKPFTRKNILKQLKEDVSFGFEKALDQRGLSAEMMYKVVSMWNWILEEGLEGFDEYAQYGLPLFKATALKYGFDNPIGDDTGSEKKYASN
jgi:hypothetical protein